MVRCNGWFDRILRFVRVSGSVVLVLTGHSGIGIPRNGSRDRFVRMFGGSVTKQLRIVVYLV